MPKNKLVEEAFIQMKQIEEAMAENAKGILASTMKEEISQLVKESLSEQDNEDEVGSNLEVDDMSTDNDDMDADTDMNVDAEIDIDSDSDSDDESPIDLTDASDEEILKVFKAMGEDDGIIVKKDGEDIHLTDNNSDSEYLVKLGESLEEEYEEEMDEQEEEMDEEEYDESVDDVIDAIFSDNGDSSDVESNDLENMDEIVYEIEFDESEEEEMDESEEEEMDESEEEEMDESEEEEMDESDKLEESKKGKSIKPKGVGIGSGPKFSYKKTTGGFKEDKKEGPKSVGTGKAKFEYKKGANMEGKSKIVKKTETKESARTLGNGSNFRKGGLPKPRAHSQANTAIKENVSYSEVSMLREKNEEYRKALNVFREKLNEVAIFNSNLAYATRLFTEHSTTKKEKINILRRFDGVETLKESKNLYKSIKDELSKSETKTIKESVEHKINKQVSTGSSTTLIESKTYENPQFLRMKDLMTKIG